MLAVPSIKILVYFDSMHNLCNGEILNMAFEYLQSIIAINEKEWSVYIPRDILLQKQTNCGLHICSWGYVTASGIEYSFEDSDMHIVRKSIANIIFKSKKITICRKK